VTRSISLRTIIWHSALEFSLTFVLLFGVVTIVRWVVGPSAVARAIPDIHLQLLIIGAAVGLLITGLILSPLGRTSGGHMLSMFVIVLTIGVCLSVPRLARAVPWIVGLFIGGAIALLGTASGGSENPARQFGPAIASGQTRFLWAYLLAPMLAAVLAAAARQGIHRGLSAHGEPDDRPRVPTGPARRAGDAPGDDRGRHSGRPGS
jgi:glycerol uptake facilitator-like aquaporin